MTPNPDWTQIRCPSCRHQPPSGSRFCNRCGSALAEAPLAGERRHLTVMFCDLVGSTELAQQLDAEELQIVVGELQNTCARVIGGLDGHVAQYLGDGLLVYFGYPQAHEDDAIHALSAALEILAALPEVAAAIARQLPERAGEPLRVRIGIHSGMLVLSDMGRGDDQPRLGMGDTVNIAARLQGAAAPGEILISEATRRLVQGAFLLEDRGELSLKGVSERVRTHRVVGSSGLQSRLERSAREGHTPLIGREQEVALALESWEQVRAGAGRALLLVGEPGIGKSRLVAVLRERIAAEPHRWLVCRCTAHQENTPFHPVIDMLEHTFEIEEADTEPRRRARIEAELRSVTIPERYIPPLVALLCKPDASTESFRWLQREDRRRQTLESLAACVERLGRDRPLVLVVEDLHWIDPSTLELLGLLVNRLERERALLVFTYRPGFEVPWRSSHQVLEIGLHRLTREQIARICTSVAKDRELPAALLADLVAKADGVPLFAEELTKAVLESDRLEGRAGRLAIVGERGHLTVPATLQESLMARLDGLGGVKELAQLCAVIGRDVSYDLLRAVSPQPEKALQAGLARLGAANLLAREGPPGQPRYVFQHALIHETAYDSLLRSDRQRLHGRIARTFQEQFPERSAAHPDVLALHHARAGSLEDAIEFYQQAAVQATDRQAQVEAIGHLERAIELIGALPASPDWDRRELELQVALGTATMIARGQGHPGVERAHARARDLGRKTADRTGLFRALWGLSRFHQSQGKMEASSALGEQMLELALETGDRSQLCWAHLALGQASFWRGDPTRCLSELEATIAICGASAEAIDANVFGQDPALSSRSLAGAAHWIVGRPDTGLRISREALEIGSKKADPFSYALALDFGAVVHQVRGERERTRELAEMAIELSREHGIPLFMGFGRVMKGWSLTLGAGDEAAIAEIHAGLSDLKAAGTGLGGPYLLALLADSLGVVGRGREALAILDAALRLAAAQESHFWDTELLRLKGEILLDLDADARDEAERLLRQALERARALGTRSFELRAGLSLARLLAARDEGEAGRDLVRGVYQRFDEGFETRDLARARELLAVRE